MITEVNQKAGDLVAAGIPQTFIYPWLARDFVIF